MIKIGKEKDEELLKSFERLFLMYGKAAEEGKYYIFQKQDILTEEIDLGSRETATSLEEGLHELGKVIYLFATGRCEDNDRSIKLDGYPKIDSIMWPVLEVLLSRQEKPSLEKAERKMEEIEKGTKKGTECENDEGETGSNENEIHGSDKEKTRIFMNGREICLSGKETALNNDAAGDESGKEEAKSFEDLLLEAGCTIMTTGDKAGPKGMNIIAPEGCGIAQYIGSDGRLFIGLTISGRLESELFEPAHYGYGIGKQKGGRQIFLTQNGGSDNGKINEQGARRPRMTWISG
ncbi:MAG: hypothetical protein WC788_01760 [Candidatus Paceibacterota bacterium]|jgi:hypothetical protein